jgi:hypothetical protein
MVAKRSTGRRMQRQAFSHMRNKNAALPPVGDPTMKNAVQVLTEWHMRQPALSGAMRQSCNAIGRIYALRLRITPRPASAKPNSAMLDGSGMALAGSGMALAVTVPDISLDSVPPPIRIACIAAIDVLLYWVVKTASNLVRSSPGWHDRFDSLEDLLKRMDQ